MSKVSELVENKIAPIIDDLGYMLIEVDFSKKVDGMNLIIIIDKESGINIEDCEKVHKIIDPILDELNPTNDQPYILSVSSPGLDRPIKNYRDFLRNKNKEVKIVLYAKVDNKKEYEGILIDFTDGFVEVLVEGKAMRFEREKIAIIHPKLIF